MTVALVWGIGVPILLGICVRQALHGQPWERRMRDNRIQRRRARNVRRYLKDHPERRP
jgi:hypothetical protein